MAVLELFSHRKRVAEGKLPDVFVYNELPRGLRIQIVHIWKKAIGSYHVYGPAAFERTTENNKGWQRIERTVAREHELFQLGKDKNVFKCCVDYLLDSPLEAALDLIEASFLYVDQVARNISQYQRKELGITVSASNAIDELNERFRRAGVGYRYESGSIVRVDSELLHAEVVQPALLFLNQPGLEGPREEFMKAHAHFRVGENRDAITNAKGYASYCTSLAH